MNYEAKEEISIVMFVLREDGTNFVNFNIPKQSFEIGEIIENERLEGKFEVIYFDMATVSVKPVQ